MVSEDTTYSPIIDTRSIGSISDTGKSLSEQLYRPTRETLQPKALKSPNILSAEKEKEKKKNKKKRKEKLPRSNYVFHYYLALTKMVTYWADILKISAKYEVNNSENVWICIWMPPSHYLSPARSRNWTSAPPPKKEKKEKNGDLNNSFFLIYYV